MPDGSTTRRDTGWTAHHTSIIPSQWFGSDMAKLKALVSEAKTKATYLLETKNRILADWESDVLCLYYAPMLAALMPS